MTAIPLGLITVPTAGTDQPITLTPAQRARISPSGEVDRVDVWANPSSAGTVSIRSAGMTIAALPVPAGGNVAHWSSGDGGVIAPTSLSLSAAVGGDGAFVTLWLD